MKLIKSRKDLIVKQKHFCLRSQTEKPRSPEAGGYSDKAHVLPNQLLGRETNDGVENKNKIKLDDDEILVFSRPSNWLVKRERLRPRSRPNGPAAHQAGGYSDKAHAAA